MHTCPMITVLVPHVGGPIVSGAPNVFIGGIPAARIGDACVCVGPPDAIAQGSSGVYIAGKPAARMGDLTAHGGVIVVGLPSVLIGETGSGSASAGAEGPSAGQASKVKDPANKGDFHTQEQGNSCVIATSRNMIKYFGGKDVPEDKLRDQMRTIIGDPNHDFETQGTDPRHAKELLKQNGVESDVLKKQSKADLEKLTANGDPVMIGFKNPGHRVGLSGVETDKDGNKTFVVMDPDPAYKGKPRRMSEKDFDKKYNDNAVVIVPK